MVIAIKRREVYIVGKKKLEKRLLPFRFIPFPVWKYAEVH